MSTLPPLPPGFKLDAPAAQAMPPLPPGFTLDQPSGPRTYDPFAEDERALPPLPGEAVTSPIAPAPAKQSYLQGVRQSFAAPATTADPKTFAEHLGNVPVIGPLYGLAEAGTTLATGAVAPAVASVKGMLTGREPTNEDIARFTYESRSAPGKAALGIAGAVAKPVTDLAEETGADVALLPLAAEAQTLRAAAQGRSNLKQVRSDAKAFTKPVAAPTTDELATAAKRAYQTAKEAGAVVSPESYGRMASGLRVALREQGFNAKLHPKAAAVLEEIEGAQGKPISFDELEILRRQALAAERSIEADERRVAALIIDRLDDYGDALIARPQEVLSGNARTAVESTREARNLYSRNRKAMEIQELMDRAEVRASQFSGSGEENALRTEFRQLALNPKRMRRFTQEEQKAIKDVAFGDNTRNALRQVGKLAPTGGLMQSLSLLGAVLEPTTLIAPAAGALARAGATRLTKRAAHRAEELMRRGPAREAAPAEQAAAPEAMTGELMPRETLALPSPSIIAAARSAPGTAYAREQMGLTPDVERAGALHPGASRQSPQRRPAALPHLPPRQAEPIVVDAQGRAATAGELSAYLDELGLDEVRNAKQGGNRFAQLAPQAPVAESIRSLVKRVESNPSDNTHAVVEYARDIHPAAVEAFKQAGVDVSGYTHVIDNSAIRHILKNHSTAGTELPRGQLPVTADDFAKLPQVIANPDRVQYLGKTRVGRDSVLYAKMLNGELIVVEEARKKRGQLAVVSMWKINRHEQMPDLAAETPAPNVRNDGGGGSLPQGEHIEMSGRRVRSRRAPIEHISANRFEQLSRGR